MFRKIFFLFFALICFMSTITTDKVLSATPVTKEAPQLRYYSKKDDSFYQSIHVTRYSKQEFNMELRITNSNHQEVCSYKSVCKQNGKNFICQGDITKNSSTGQTVSGTITPDVIEILKSNDSEICKDNASLMGKYKFVFDRDVKGPTTRTITVTPIRNDASEDNDVYLLKDKNGEDFYVDNLNNTEILQKFYNSWINLEYIVYTRYSDGENVDDYVIFKINGKNPIEIK